MAIFETYRRAPAHDERVACFDAGQRSVHCQDGHRRDVFEGNVDWLDEVAAFIVEPHDWMLPGAGSSRGIQKALGARNFDLLLSGENLIYMCPPRTQ